MQTLNAIECSGLSHAFGGRSVLKNVSFVITKGTFSVVLGCNGAGKTTLFSLIARLYHAQTGSIQINGFDIRKSPRSALASIGIVFQQPTIDLDLSVRETLSYQAALQGLSRKQSRMRLREEIQRIGLTDRLDDRIRKLSGGMRRRVEISRALMHKPRLLLLDEPTAGLDIMARGVILNHIHSLCRNDGTSAMWATHLIDEAEAADLVLVLHEGSLVACGPPAKILTQLRDYPYPTSSGGQSINSSACIER